MKIDKHGLRILAILLFVISCEKNNCPAPIKQPNNVSNPEAQKYTYSIKYDPITGIDAHLVYNNFTGGNLNYPLEPTLYAEAWTNMGTPQRTRTIIDFPLDSIPSGAVITKATLTLFADTTNPVAPKYGHSALSGPNDWVIKKIISPWSENSVTWNNQPSTNNIDTLLMASSTSGDQRYDIDITKFITERHQNPNSNYGYLFKLNNESIYRSIAFCSSDHQYPELRPELKIEYWK